VHLQACSGKPCRNGGTCWSSANTFYCACRPGFTGKTCQGNQLTLFAATTIYVCNIWRSVCVRVGDNVNLDGVGSFFTLCVCALYPSLFISLVFAFVAICNTVTTKLGMPVCGHIFIYSPSALIASREEVAHAKRARER
jgi:EGF-like domain